MTTTFGTVIYSYTWDDAIRDGTFVQLSGPGYPAHGDAWVPEMVAEAGIRHPLALTREVFHDCVMPIGESEELAPTQDSKGRLWDVLFMLRMAIRRATGRDLTFELRVVKNCPAGKAKITPFPGSGWRVVFDFKGGATAHVGNYGKLANAKKAAADYYAAEGK